MSVNTKSGELEKMLIEALKKVGFTEIEKNRLNNGKVDLFVLSDVHISIMGENIFIPELKYYDSEIVIEVLGALDLL